MSCDRKFPKFAAHLAGTVPAVAAVFGGEADRVLRDIVDTARNQARRATIPEEPPAGAPPATRGAYLEWRAKEREAKVLCAALFKRMQAAGYPVPTHRDAGAAEFDGASLPGKRDAIHGYAEAERAIRAIEKGAELPPLARLTWLNESNNAWSRVLDELTPVMEGELEWRRQQDALAGTVGVARRILSGDERPPCTSEGAYDRLVLAAEELDARQQAWLAGDIIENRRRATMAAVAFAARYRDALGLQPFDEDTVEVEGGALVGRGMCAWAIANDDQLRELALRDGLYRAEIDFKYGPVDTLEWLEDARRNVIFPDEVERTLDAFWEEHERQRDEAESAAERDFDGDLESGYWSPDTDDPEKYPPDESDVDLDPDDYPDEAAYQAAVAEAIDDLKRQRAEQRADEIETERERRKREARESPPDYQSQAVMDVARVLRGVLGGSAEALPQRERFLGIIGVENPAAEALRRYPAIRELAAMGSPVMQRPESGVLHPLEDLAKEATRAADLDLARIGRRLRGMRNFRATRGASYHTDLRDFARAVEARAEGRPINLASWDARAASVALQVENADLPSVVREFFHPDYKDVPGLDAAVRALSAAQDRAARNGLGSMAVDEHARTLRDLLARVAAGKGATV